MIKIKCYFCNKKEACAKVGEAKINWMKVLKGKFLEKIEYYVCKKCLEEIR